MPQNMHTPAKQREAAIRFARQWETHGDERPEAQQFWMQLSAEVLGVEHPFGFDKFQAEHRDAKGGFSDIMLPSLGLLVEQKSASVDLDKQESRQGRMVTPLQQALDYNNSFPFDDRQRVICVCNFHEFRFYDLNDDPLAQHPPYARFTLEQLPDNLHVFRALIDNRERRHVTVAEHKRVDVTAARHVATLNRHLARFYRHADEDEREHMALALTTVRLVFLYYAEDSGLLRRGQFTDYVESLQAGWLGDGLAALFRWVDTTPERRETAYPNPVLAAFPYIDGGLFHDDIPIPVLDEDFKQALLDMGRGFDWSAISPVIFGSLMEETLSHDERRQGGMHYTSPENIHKLIDPLFLDDLKTELDGLTAAYDNPTSTPQRHRADRNRLIDYQNKLASLQFLDPACGSGNFLTETFLSLRALEDQILVRLQKGDIMLDLGEEYQPVKVSIRQMHGIEINGFACSVARTALWIAEQQALDRTEALCGNHYDRLPLTDSGDIIHGNALQTDWNTLLPGHDCDYVMGNPPFIGRGMKTEEQVEETRHEFGKDYDGNLDYSANWFHRAAAYLKDSPTSSFAFVSTNSITQGLPVPALFQPLFNHGWHIDFAHRSFEWDAQSTDNAQVCVVIIGMSRNVQHPRLYTYENVTSDPLETYPENINAYLLDAPNIFVTKRLKPLCPMLRPVLYGSKPTDGGHFFLNSREEYEEAMNDPTASKYVRRFVGANELINQKPRYCLWLADVEPSELRKSKLLHERVEAVRQFRLESHASSTRQWADQPWLFKQRAQPETPYLAIPCHFSDNREYMTCARFTEDVIVGNACFSTEDPDGLAFAVIESGMFMTWQDAIGGRLGNGYRFSNTLVWNNLPLPALDTDTCQKIIAAGQSILAARRNHPDASLADLYDPLVMPADLRRAHRELDELVDVAFGAERPCASEAERLQVLFDSYMRLSGESVSAVGSRRSRLDSSAADLFLSRLTGVILE